MAFMRRKRLPDGSFGELEKVGSGETAAETVERLESDNAALMYDAMTKDARITDLATAQGELLYQLMMNGVI